MLMETGAALTGALAGGTGLAVAAAFWRELYAASPTAVLFATLALASLMLAGVAIAYRARMLAE
jgi:hypothetical protein